MAAYERNTGRVHTLVGGIITSKRRDTGSDPLTDYNADLWYGFVSIGTPPKTFTSETLPSANQNRPLPYAVDFDTGSSDLFVPSTNCNSTCSGHKLYDPSASSTSRDLGKTFSLAYGDGSTVSGEQYNDTVTIAGLCVR